MVRLVTMLSYNKGVLMTIVTSPADSGRCYLHRSVMRLIPLSPAILEAVLFRRPGIADYPHTLA